MKDVHERARKIINWIAVLFALLMLTVILAETFADDPDTAEETPYSADIDAESVWE